MTQGKIECYHRSMKHQIRLESYYLAGELEARVAASFDSDNDERYHEILDKLTTADVYSGRGQRILERRARIKRQTIALRRKSHRKLAA